MNKVLVQLSVAVGGILFVIVLLLALQRGVPLMAAIFRGVAVMSISSVVMVVFARFFMSLLYRFVAEEVLRQQSDDRAGSKQTRPSTINPDRK